MKKLSINRKGQTPVITLENTGIPEFPADQVLIKVEYAGLNPVDWKTAEGLTLADSITTPYTPGWDCAGRVEKTGSECTRFKAGDRVFGLVGFPDKPGTFAQYYTAPENQIAQIPESLSFEEAAAVPLTALTAWQGLYGSPNLESGQKILIHGASGGVGNFAVQFAAISGAETWGTASPHHFKELRELGLNHPVDRTAGDFISTLPKHFFDFIFDSRGNAVREHAHELLLKGGGIVSLRSGSIPEKEYRKAGITYRHMLVHPDGKAMEKIAALFLDNKLQVQVKHIFPMNRLSEALELSKTGSVNGKIVLRCR